MFKMHPWSKRHTDGQMVRILKTEGTRLTQRARLTWFLLAQKITAIINGCFDNVKIFNDVFLILR